VVTYGRNYTCEHGEEFGYCCPMPYDLWLRSQLVDTDGLDRLPDPDPLIGPDLMFRDSLVWLIGKPGHGKSFVSLDWAGCVASGENWQGFATHHGPVLYLAAEGVTGIKRRVRAWEKSYGHRMTGVDFLPTDVQVKAPSHWDALVDLAKERQYALIVLDTQARITLGLDENSNTEMGTFVDRAEQLRRASGACVVIVHHVGKADNGGRGATAVEGAVSTIVKAVRDGERITLTCTKNKDGSEWEQIDLRMVPMAGSVVLAVDDGTARTEDRPKWLHTWWEIHRDEPVSISVLVKSGVTSESTFHREKRRLLDTGVIKKEGAGNGTRYVLATDPAGSLTPV